jgi:methionine aminopeptidase
MSLTRSFSDHQLVVLQDDEWLERQRIAGRSVVFCLESAKSMIENRKELTVSSLKGEAVLLMKGFDCTQVLTRDKSHKSSVNIYVNGIFNKEDDSYKFQDGDLIKLEIASSHKGAVAKSIITVIKGKSKSFAQTEMLKVCQKALENAIAQIEVGKRLGSIGAGIKYIVKNSSFRIVQEHFGNGLDEDNIFANPVVLNKSQFNTGIRIQPGMTFTVSPALSIDGKLGCCFEKTIFVNENKVEIITPWSEVN